MEELTTMIAKGMKVVSITNSVIQNTPDIGLGSNYLDSNRSLGSKVFKKKKKARKTATKSRKNNRKR